MKIGIIGGGAAGLMAAWLLEENYDVVLFEKENILGGHAQTIYVPFNEEKIPIEIGFEFFNQILFPNFYHLLTLLNVPIRTFPLTYTFYTQDQQTTTVFPLFRNHAFAWKMLVPKNLITLLQFSYFMKAGNTLVKNKNIYVTLRQFVDTLSLSKSFKNNFLYPFLAAGWGAEINDFKTFAAYDVLKWIDKTPARLWPEQWYEIINGTSSYIETLAKQLSNTTIKLSSTIATMSFKNQKYGVHESDGTITHFDHLIVATNPQEAFHLLKNLIHTVQIRSALNKIESFPTAIAVHADRNFMPKKESDWSVTNIRYDGKSSAITVYKPWKSSQQLFRSWIIYKENEAQLPHNLYALKHFHHQKVTPSYFVAQTELKKSQGVNNLWFAGTYTHDIDSHESALVSALLIAQKLAPHSKRFKHFLELNTQNKQNHLHVSLL